MPYPVFKSQLAARLGAFVLGERRELEQQRTKSTARYRAIRWPCWVLNSRCFDKLQGKGAAATAQQGESARVLSLFSVRHDNSLLLLLLYVYEVSVTSRQFAAAEHWIGTENQIKLPRQAPAGLVGGWSGNSSP